MESSNSCELSDSGDSDELYEFVEYCKNSDFCESGGFLGYADSCDSGELSDFGEYGITWDSDESGDPGGFGDSGDFYEPAHSCEFDYFSETVHSVDS